MRFVRHSGAALIAALSLAALGAGCGSSTKATPLNTTTTTAAPAGVTPSTPAPATPTSATATTTAGGSGTSGADAAQLAAVSRELGAAVSSLSGSGTAINGADVDQAKAQEGTAP